MIPILFEAAGLVAALVALFFTARSSRAIPRGPQVALLLLLGLIIVLHLANVFEWSGATWADTLADHLSVAVPLFWGLFLFEVGRGYLSAQVDAGTEQLRFFLEKVPIPVACLSADGALQAYSFAWQHALPGSAPGVPLANVLPVPLPNLERCIATCVQDGKEAHCLEDEAEDQAGNTRYFRWELRRWVHPDHQRPLILLVLEEITSHIDSETQRLMAAEELSRAQRLAHVAQLAAGAAHDFNNLLHVIYAAALELRENPGDERASRDLDSALQTATNLTRAMLQFGKLEGDTRGAVDFRQVVVDLQGLLNQALGRRHEIVVSLTTDHTLRVDGSKVRLQQAVLNLLLNARDAMPEGGSIELTLGAHEAGVQLMVRDFGVGMTEDVRKQLFTPFFTTKGQLGTGLGLGVVRSVVEEHRGRLSVESEPGVGTTFCIWLPLMKGDVQSLPPA
jgi:signal transduction histidine kinase